MFPKYFFITEVEGGTKPPTALHLPRSLQSTTKNEINK